MNVDELPSGKVSLRRLTLKSVLGFGQHNLLTVLEIINLKRSDYLIWVYYHASNIDFNEEVKEYLRITPEREVAKPGKNPDLYPKFRGSMLLEIIDRDGTYDEGHPEKYFLLHEKKAAKKHKIIVNCIRQNKERSKIHNRDRNQKH